MGGALRKAPWRHGGYETVWKGRWLRLQGDYGFDQEIVLFRGSQCPSGSAAGGWFHPFEQDIHLNGTVRVVEALPGNAGAWE